MGRVRGEVEMVVRKLEDMKMDKIRLEVEEEKLRLDKGELRLDEEEEEEEEEEEDWRVCHLEGKLSLVQDVVERGPRREDLTRDIALEMASLTRWPFSSSMLKLIISISIYPRHCLLSISQVAM